MEVPSILLHRLLSEAAKKKASSLHLTIGGVPTIRVNRQLMPMEGENILTLDLLEKIINSFLDPEEAKELAERKEIITVKTFANSLRFRTNIFYQKRLPAVSFYFIPEVIRNFEELHFPEAISQTIKRKSGLLVLAGSFGQGKTATAAMIIEELNKTENRRIVTLEKPIEYTFISRKSVIEQRQVGKDVNTLVEGLNYCLTEDFDLIYVGEIKAEFNEAMPLICELAAGNSLVVLEINADNSIRAVEKILNALKLKMSDEAARYNIADVMAAVITERLIPKRGGGLALAAEILLGNEAVKSLIREGKIYQLESTIQTSRKEGMVNMARAIEELVEAGEIRKEDA